MEIVDVYADGIYQGSFESAVWQSDYFGEEGFQSHARHRLDLEERCTGAGNESLTEAIAERRNIDFEKLDGRHIMLNHESGARVHLKLERDKGVTDPGSARAWLTYPVSDYLFDAFACAWDGCHGWDMDIVGEVPIKILTAADLRPGEIVTVRAAGSPGGDVQKVVGTPRGVIDVNTGYALSTPLGAYLVVESL